MTELQVVKGERLSWKATPPGRRRAHNYQDRDQMLEEIAVAGSFPVRMRTDKGSVVFVLDGHLTLTGEGESTELSRGDSIHLNTYTDYCFEGAGTLLAFGLAPLGD
jgi:mannose-6-phosphate isomerase class I